MKNILYKTTQMLEIENKAGEEIEEILRRKYVDENKSTQIIADELSISYVTAFKWINLAGVHSHLLKL